MPLVITMPIERSEVSDNSEISTHQRCPTKGLYQYGLNRAPIGTNYPIQFGVSYHKFREILEVVFEAHPREGDGLLDKEWQRETYELAWYAASKKFEDPPLDHKKAYLTTSRLSNACQLAFENWLHEKATGRYVVLFNEQAFDLALPSGRRFGGRFDQILEWNGKLWIRDFKTVSRMGKTYGDQFEPNNQMTGYVWAAQELSGRRVEGVIIDVCYNTKNQGPEFHEFLTTRTPEHIERWLETIESETKEIDRYYEAGVFPMRTQACHDYGGCYFREACKKSSWPMIERWLEANTVESHWDFMNPEAEEGVVD
jgi:hypothetical protein